jgi:hypothetical protein
MSGIPWSIMNKGKTSYNAPDNSIPESERLNTMLDYMRGNPGNAIANNPKRTIQEYQKFANQPENIAAESRGLGGPEADWSNSLITNQIMDYINKQKGYGRTL